MGDHSKPEAPRANEPHEKSAQTASHVVIEQLAGAHATPAPNTTEHVGSLPNLVVHDHGLQVASSGHEAAAAFANTNGHDRHVTPGGTTADTTVGTHSSAAPQRTLDQHIEAMGNGAPRTRDSVVAVGAADTALGTQAHHEVAIGPHAPSPAPIAEVTGARGTHTVQQETVVTPAVQRVEPTHHEAAVVPPAATPIAEVTGARGTRAVQEGTITAPAAQRVEPAHHEAAVVPTAATPVAEVTGARGTRAVQEGTITAPAAQRVEPAHHEAAVVPTAATPVAEVTGARGTRAVQEGTITAPAAQRVEPTHHEAVVVPPAATPVAEVTGARGTRAVQEGTITAPAAQRVEPTHHEAVVATTAPIQVAEVTGARGTRAVQEGTITAPAAQRVEPAHHEAVVVPPAATQVAEVTGARGTRAVHEGTIAAPAAQRVEPAHHEPVVATTAPIQVADLTATHATHAVHEVPLAAAPSGQHIEPAHHDVATTATPIQIKTNETNAVESLSAAVSRALSPHEPLRTVRETSTTESRTESQPTPINARPVNLIDVMREASTQRTTPLPTEANRGLPVAETRANTIDIHPTAAHTSLSDSLASALGSDVTNRRNIPAVEFTHNNEPSLARTSTPPGQSHPIEATAATTRGAEIVNTRDTHPPTHSDNINPLGIISTIQAKLQEAPVSRFFAPEANKPEHIIQGPQPTDHRSTSEQFKPTANLPEILVPHFARSTQGPVPTSAEPIQVATTSLLRRNEATYEPLKPDLISKIQELLTERATHHSASPVAHIEATVAPVLERVHGRSQHDMPTPVLNLAKDAPAVHLVAAQIALFTTALRGETQPNTTTEIKAAHQPTVEPVRTNAEPAVSKIDTGVARPSVVEGTHAVVQETRIAAAEPMRAPQLETIRAPQPDAVKMPAAETTRTSASEVNRTPVAEPPKPPVAEAPRPTVADKPTPIETPRPTVADRPTAIEPPRPTVADRPTAIETVRPVSTEQIKPAQPEPTRATAQETARPTPVEPVRTTVHEPVRSDATTLSAANNRPAPVELVSTTVQPRVEAVAKAAAPSEPTIVPTAPSVRLTAQAEVVAQVNAAVTAQAALDVRTIGSSKLDSTVRHHADEQAQRLLGTGDTTTADTTTTVRAMAFRPGQNKRYLTGAEIALGVVLVAGAISKLRPETQEQQKTADTIETYLQKLSAATYARETYIVNIGDTLVGIGEALYDDGRVGYLIADINQAATKEIRMDGKRIVELMSRQTIFLPNAQDIELFYGRDLKECKPENLVTIITEREFDRQMVNMVMTRAMGVTAEMPRPQPALVPVAAAQPVAAAAHARVPVNASKSRDDNHGPTVPPQWGGGAGAITLEAFLAYLKGKYQPQQDAGSIARSKIPLRYKIEF